jgi:hypothetical protein
MMDTQKIKGALKEHWPIAVGVVGGLLLIMWYRGRSSGGGGDTYGALLAQQAAAGQQNAAMSLQLRQLEIQAAAQERQANIASMQAQGEVAGQLASGAGTLIQALNAPTVAAINAGAAENVATIQSSVAAAIGGFQSQAEMVSAAGMATHAYAAGIASQTNTLAQLLGVHGQSISSINQTASPTIQHQPPDNFGNLMSGIGQIAAAYYTGGASLAVA